MSENKKLGFAGKMAHVFVNNSRLSVLLIIALFAWGIFSFFITPKQYNPEIVRPTFQIVTEYPGATASEVEELVTKPLEAKLSEIKGLDEVSSHSINGGASVVVASFYVGEDIEESKIKIIQKIYSNIGLKPTGVNEPIIKEINPYNVPVITAAFSSSDYKETTLRKMVADLKEKIERVPGSTNAEIVGGRKTQLKILLNPNKLNAQKIAIPEIVQALKENNLKLPGGYLEVGEKNVAVEVDGRFDSADEVAKVVLRNEGDHTVLLEDVATVEKAGEEEDDFVKYKTSESSSPNVVYLSLAKKKGENISKVTDGVINKINKLKENKTIPGNVNVDFVKNQGEVAGEEVMGLVRSLIQAIAIVSIILFLFLGRRAALIVIIAIPLILFSVFGVGYLAGETINRITLFALILSLGLLVDNAIVVVENAVRFIRKKNEYKKTMGDEEVCLTKDEKRECVLDSVDEVGPGILMATITTVLAFIPMAFVTGMMGPYMGPIPFFVPITLIFSLLIAFTINPFLSSVFLKEDSKKKKVSGRFDKIKKSFLNFSSKVSEKYRSFLYKVFRNKGARRKFLGAVFLVFLVMMSLPVFQIVKFRMLPKADKEKFYVYLDYPQGTLVEENNEVTTEVENFLLDREETVSIQSFIGTPPVLDFNGLFRGVEGRKDSHHATIKVNITKTESRDKKSAEIVSELRPKLYKFLEDEPGVKIKLVEDPPGPPVRSTALLKIKGEDYDTLKKISYDMEEVFKETEGVVDVDTSRVGNMKKTTLLVDHEKALRSGLSSRDIAYTLNSLLSGAEVSVFHDNRNTEQEYIFLRMKENFRDENRDLDSIYISNRQGEKIPLSEIVIEDEGNIEDVIERDEGEKVVYVTGEMQDRSVTYAALNIFPRLWNYNLPDNNGEVENVSFFGVDYSDKQTGEDYSIEWGGEWKLTVEVFRDLGAAMMVAIFLIYLVLVAQFHSFRVPVLIMITIPLAMIGIMPGFALLGFSSNIYFNATSMIGVIALAGIVVNNAILMIEYLNSYRKKGYSLEESLVEAGAVRARPIMLTSLTTVLGSLVMISDPVWAGLAWSIAFGLSISAVLTLVVFPVLYFSFARR